MNKGDPSSPSEGQNKLIAYLDEFGKQMNNRRNSNGLEEQLSILSKAYNQAQQKLLETQRALMSQSILLEKHRSVIQLYRHLLSQDIEDDGILCFVSALQEQQQKQDIHSQLQNIRSILARRKRREAKRSYHDQRTVKDLKKQLSRLEEERQSFSEESQIINSQNEELKEELRNYKQIIDKIEQQKEEMQLKIQKIQDIVQEKEKEILNMAEKIKIKDLELAEMGKIQKQLKNTQAELNNITSILVNSLQIIPSNNQNRDPNRPLGLNFSKLQSTLQQLHKYKSQYKTIKNQSQPHLKQQISLLKLFLSQQALSLFKQYEQQPLECLENELRNLSCLQKNKLIRLQSCQKDIWMYKMMLIREQQHQSSGQQSFRSLRSQGAPGTIDAQLIQSVLPHSAHLPY